MTMRGSIVICRAVRALAQQREEGSESLMGTFLLISSQEGLWRP